jgi:hypothetical protein
MEEEEDAAAMARLFDRRCRAIGGVSFEAMLSRLFPDSFLRHGISLCIENGYFSEVQIPHAAFDFRQIANQQCRTV